MKTTSTTTPINVETAPQSPSRYSRTLTLATEAIDLFIRPLIPILLLPLAPVIVPAAICYQVFCQSLNESLNTAP